MDGWVGELVDRWIIDLKAHLPNFGLQSPDTYLLPDILSFLSIILINSGNLEGKKLPGTFNEMSNDLVVLINL